MTSPLENHFICDTPRGRRAGATLAICLAAVGVIAGSAAEARWYGRGYYVYEPPGIYVEPPPYYVAPPVYAPPPVYVVPPVYSSPPVRAPLAPAAPQSWYFCEKPQGYYPYVEQCESGWRQVPATPNR